MARNKTKNSPSQVRGNSSVTQSAPTAQPTLPAQTANVTERRPTITPLTPPILSRGNLGVLSESDLMGGEGIDRLGVGTLITSLPGLAGIPEQQLQSGGTASQPDVTDAQQPQPPLTEGPIESLLGDDYVEAEVEMNETEFVTTVIPAVTQTASQSIPEYDRATPEGYPAPSSVLNVPGVNLDMLTAEQMRLLAAYNPADVLSAGVVTVSMLFSTVHLSVSEQMMFGVIGRHYSSLPTPPYDLQTFKLLHFVAKTHSHRHDPTNDANIRGYYTIISNNSLEEWCLKLGLMLLKAETLNVREIKEVMSEAECLNSLEDMRVRFPVLFGAYKVVYNICHGGLQNIAPIPGLAQHHAELAQYIDTIANGENNLLTVAPRIDVRNSSLPHSNPGASAVVPQRSLEEIRKTNIETSSKVSTVNQSSWDEMMKDALNLPAAPRSHVVGESSATGEARSPVPQARPSSLLGQGYTGQPPVIRDTSMFRGVVQNDEESRQLLINLSTQMQTIIQGLAANTVQYENIMKRLDVMDRSFAAALSRGSLGDLNQRSSYNATIFTPPRAVATSVMQSQPQVSNAVAGERVDNLIAGLMAVTAGVPSNELVQEAIRILNEGGFAGAAAGVSAYSLGTVTARRKLIQLLKTVPRS